MIATPVNLSLIDAGLPGASIAGEVRAGLSQAQKTLPAKWFYDARGSELFEAICALPEYYVTRTETALMAREIDAIAGCLAPAAVLIEPGSGAGIKTRMLIEAAAPAAYVAIDISRSMLEQGAAATAQCFPSLRVVAIHADYTALENLPLAATLAAAPRTLYFPGSTVGNFTAGETRAFLHRVARWLGPQGSILIGVDTKKDVRVLEAAYDDAQGVTARFNLNLLVRLNAELGADFDLGQYRHLARYNAAEGRIEMHLESCCDQTVRVAGGVFNLRRGETIHTENSCKYAPAEFRALAQSAGWRCAQTWTDEREWFAIYHLLADGAAQPAGE
jgi:L-histidine Nalpha-methyltransferase